MSLFGFKKHKKKRAGLFIDRGYFRYLTVVGLPGSYVVTDAVSGELSEEVTQGGDPFTSNGMYLYQVMNEILHNVGSIDVPVRLSLPTTDSLLRVVNFPNMSLYEAKLAFRYEFENYFPFPIEEGIYDLAEIFYPLQNGAEESRYLVGAARKTLIENITKAAKANGIEITAIEPAQIALERAVTPITPVSDASVFIYAGKTRSVLIFSWKGNGIFYRTMSIGFTGISFVDESFNEQLNAEYNAFAREIHSSLQFALSQMRGFKPDMFFLKESLSIPEIMLSDPISLHGLAFDSSAGSWDIPIGLALR
ncbi:MAG: pilus assembly protein PilM [Synergistaceae bacterium]|jgi:type IV pilus assembly protein PilM|nr:pilus assembly protein PilM [Synergistaceae bacterium]